MNQAFLNDYFSTFQIFLFENLKELKFDQVPGYKQTGNIMIPSGVYYLMPVKLFF